MAIKTRPKDAYEAERLSYVARNPNMPPAAADYEAFKAARSVGRPPSGKRRVTLLLDPDVIEKFRATGKGWQARMNEALKAAKQP